LKRIKRLKIRLKKLIYVNT